MLEAEISAYRANAMQAQAKIPTGESKAGPKPDVPVLAEWTLVASQLLNPDETLKI